MEAVICTKYGPPEVLQIKEIEKPTPKKNEILIKVYATTVHIGDTKVRRLDPGMGPVKNIIFRMMIRLVIGFRKPRKEIFGMELAGEVVETGSEATLFKKGDAVFATTEFGFGAYVQYRCMPEKGIIALKPENMSYQEAAPVSNGGLTALLYLRKAGIMKGQKVLIYGASGSVGTYAIQLAKYFGTEVTAVCSTSNLDLVKSLGADKAIDYTREDFSQGSEKYDIIFDAVGKIPASKRKKALNKTGRYLNVLSITTNIRLKIEDLHYLKELCDKGAIKTVIDRCYTLEEIVEAHRYVDKGHKKGHVVINVKHYPELAY